MFELTDYFLWLAMFSPSTQLWTGGPDPTAGFYSFPSRPGNGGSGAPVLHRGPAATGVMAPADRPRARSQYPITTGKLSNSHSI